MTVTHCSFLEPKAQNFILGMVAKRCALPFTTQVDNHSSQSGDIEGRCSMINRIGSVDSIFSLSWVSSHPPWVDHRSVRSKNLQILVLGISS